MPEMMDDDRSTTAATGGQDTTDDPVDALRAEAEAKTREAAEAQDRYLRTLADFDNFRKRVGRERDEWRRQAQEQVLREILPVLDNFDRALAAEPGGGGDAGFRAGVELIHRDFLKALERVGVRPFSAVGEFFDPQRHEAVARVERDDVADQTIVKEMLRGYLFRDRVLRPAQVVVAVEPAPPPERGEGF
ncbi:MAG TPA: nucleotide exchange factor GrpE [Methylomirabilota bacterium]|jgi:molecular chaperone GrpE|nr:nucleotide exchange factor GrpE [Methylomirabilota bacterium]